MKRWTRRGIVNSVETLLLVAATVAIALAAMFYLASHVSAEAASSKSMITIADAQAWYYASTPAPSSNPAITATIYVTNIGNAPARIDDIKLLTSAYSCYYEKKGVNVIVKPGETVPISTELKLASNYCAGATIPPRSIITITYTAAGHTAVVSAPITVSKAS